MERTYTARACFHGFSSFSLDRVFSSLVCKSNFAYRTCPLSIKMRLYMGTSNIATYSTVDNASLGLQEHWAGLATTTLDWLRFKISIKVSFFSTPYPLLPDGYSNLPTYILRLHVQRKSTRRWPTCDVGRTAFSQKHQLKCWVHKNSLKCIVMNLTAFQCSDFTPKYIQLSTLLKVARELP